MPAETFFYHSFPRPRAGNPEQLGLHILGSILDRGLLLTPEKFEFREALVGGSTSPPWQIFQKRICFTELSPQQLGEHAKTFGKFAIEFDIPVLRRMGAVPVFYIPLNSEGTEGAAAAMLARLGEIQTLLTRVETIKTFTANRQTQELLN